MRQRLLQRRHRLPLHPITIVTGEVTEGDANVLEGNGVGGLCGDEFQGIRKQQQWKVKTNPSGSSPLVDNASDTATESIADRLGELSVADGIHSVLDCQLSMFGMLRLYNILSCPVKRCYGSPNHMEL